MELRSHFRKNSKMASWPAGSDVTAWWMFRQAADRYMPGLRSRLFWQGYRDARYPCFFAIKWHAIKRACLTAKRSVRFVWVQNSSKYAKYTFVYTNSHRICENDGNETKFYEFLLKFIQKTPRKTFTIAKNMVYLYQTVDGDFFVQKLYRRSWKP